MLKIIRHHFLHNYVEHFLKIVKTSVNLLLENITNKCIIFMNKGVEYMNIKYDEMDKLLTCQITEEIDHHTTEKIRRILDDEIERYMPRKIVFNFDKVSFMDSAGIGMILGRYKIMKMIGGTVEIINANSSINKIFEMSGMHRIISINNGKKIA